MRIHTYVDVQVRMRALLKSVRSSAAAAESKQRAQKDRRKCFFY